MTLHWGDPDPTWNIDPNSSTTWSVQGYNHDGPDIVWQSDTTSVVRIGRQSGTANHRCQITSPSTGKLGVSKITATQVGRGSVSATIIIGSLFAYDSNGRQYEAPSSRWIPVDRPEFVPEQGDMESPLAWVDGGPSSTYVLDMDGLSRPPDVMIYYGVSPSAGLHSETPTIYAYPPVGSVLFPTGSIYQLDGGGGAGRWSASHSGTIPSWASMNENEAGIAWQPDGDVNNVTCYIMNWAQIQKDPGKDVYYYAISKK